MTKTMYTYRGKELKIKLQKKLELLQELLQLKEKELENAQSMMMAPRPQSPILEMMKIESLTDSDDDPKAKLSILKSIVNETKFQINKCKLLINECTREPRRKFILDFDDLYWLTF